MYRLKSMVAAGLLVASLAMATGNANAYANPIVQAAPKSKTSAKCLAKVTQVKLNAASKSLLVGEAFQIVPKVTATGNMKYTIKYASSNTKVAAVNSKGKVTAIAEGNTIITVAVSSLKATLSIKVSKPISTPLPTPTSLPPATVKSLDLKLPTEIDSDAAVTAKINVTMEPTDANAPAVSFFSDNPGIASINSDGALEIHGVGKVNVKAVAGDATVEKSITVKPKVTDLAASIESNLINGKFLMVLETAKLNIRKTTKPAGIPCNVKISSENDCAKVDESGNVVALKPGTAQIAVEAGGKKAIVPIVIYDANTDTDKDGLSDDQELHKYFSDPEKYSTFGDGISDGNWDRRRQFTYTVEETVKILQPFSYEYMKNNKYFDAKLIDQTDSMLTVDLIMYPYTNYKVFPNYNWQTQYKNDPSLYQFIKPGITSNWDEGMKADLLKELKANGIDPDKLSDVELVQKVLEWIGRTTSMAKVNEIYQLPEWCASYKDNKPYIKTEFRDSFDKIKLDPSVSDQYLLDNFVLGKQMYYNKHKGTCSSTSIYVNTIFKALGIPCRTIAIVSAKQGAKANYLYTNGFKVEEAIKNSAVNQLIQNGGGAHHCNQAYIGNTWVNIDGTSCTFNFDLTYQNLLSFIPNYYNDFSDFNITENWAFKQWHFEDYIAKYGIRLPSESYRMLYNSYFAEPLKLTDLSGSHSDTNPYMKLWSNKSKYLSNLFVTQDIATFPILRRLTSVDWTWGWAKLTEDEFNNRKMIVILDNGTYAIEMSQNASNLFSNMYKNDKNYLNVKVIDGKLVVYVKAESQQKLLEILDQLDESDFYMEQYKSFDAR